MPRALVTGAGGFIGSHLVAALRQRGWSVRALVRYVSSGSTGLLDPAGMHAGVEIVRGDLRDADCVDAAVQGADVVFNLAALIGIPYSYEAPESYLQTNVGGTLNVLRAVRRSGARLVQTSTSEVYGSAQTTPMDETHPLHPQSPYAASKVASDQLALSFHRSFAAPVVVLRPFNTYGPGQSPRAVVPTIVSQVLFADRVRIGSLDPIRDFLYVADTCRAFVAAGETAGLEGGVFSCATGRGISVGDLIERVFAVTGRRLPVEQDASRVRPEASEVDRLIGSYQRLAARTGWAPAVDLDDGLRHVVEWAAAHRGAFDVGAYAR
jgi:NAD dependent epimerase/dehydratase